MRRVVLDLNVVVSGLIEPLGPSFGVIRAALRREGLRPVVCPRWIVECDAVLGRTKFRSRFSHEEGRAVLEALVRVPESFDDPVESDVPLTGDPDDDYLVALARGAGCDAIVSGDEHLLALVEADPEVIRRIVVLPPPSRHSTGDVLR